MSHNVNSLRINQKKLTEDIVSGDLRETEKDFNMKVDSLTETEAKKLLKNIYLNTNDKPQRHNLKKAVKGMIDNG
ncbi:MAG: hypothetical protein ACOCQN_00595 [Halanaerobiaceae bacterium]